MAAPSGGEEGGAHAFTGELLLDGAIMLGAALVFVTLFRRLGLGATLGYIVGGAMIGPFVLGLVGNAENIMSISEFGIALLLFIVGLELNPSRLWRLRRDIFGLGVVQVLSCGLALSALAHLVLGFSWEAGLAIGMSLSLSSTAQVLPMLRSTGELHQPHGERAFSVLLLQDISIVPLLTLIAALSRAPADPSDPGGVTLALYTVGAIIGLIVAGRFVINPFFRVIGRLGERELFVVAALFTVVGAAALMSWLGLSTALGAFVAGVMLAESPYRHELESDVEPFRSILLGFFFLSVGMMLDLGVIAARPGTVILCAVGIVVVKGVMISGLGRAFGLNLFGALRLGLLLSQAGEFGFVLLAQAMQAQLVAPEGVSLFGAVITLTMATTPLLMMLIDRLEARHSQGAGEREGPEAAPKGQVIVVGYGRFGQTVSQMLMAKKIGVTLIDKDADQIDIAEEFGFKVYYGDGMRLDLLRTAGAENARAILFCNDRDDVASEALEAVAEAFPQAALMVRSYDRRHSMALDGLDLAFCVRELFESAVLMGKAALTELGFSQDEAERVEREYRNLDAERLERQSKTGDLHAGKERMFKEGQPMGPDGKLKPSEEGR
ncbi:monovalent cation:proton antiporter-2 (CPA2) family protein [Sphingomicrobium astaxanthinifaciens]|uniref:monovalent cation:proton antiporter-2 (CPA2) family protein n=1 Tax=Sphingomicrobium astaxanthinifaciens TaxID=1227949 RepID=UPI001FCAB561|nr:monovalent cation:proton antiporter-2 (CPA2) family protein [Sphingomicrobium astaxanthinifaciens]MCJ7420631.1 monovalent cation:proton antiporter-2 (CPA2) family protein [Sphingomicrobium astaxanthinifaciens]